MTWRSLSEKPALLAFVLVVAIVLVILIILIVLVVALVFVVAVVLVVAVFLIVAVVRHFLNPPFGLRLLFHILGNIYAEKTRRA